MEQNPNFHETDQGLILQIKVTPRAKSNQITGWENGVLKIKVTACPEKGEANHAVVLLLSKTLNIPQKNVVLMRGSTTRIKQFCLVGITKMEAEEKLSLKF